MRQRQTRQGVRRGMAFIIALIFISIFACMAVAVASTTQSNMVVARNRINTEQSLAIAEGGLCLVLRNLGGVNVGGAADAAALRQALGQQLKTTLATSSMLNANNITWDASGVHLPTAIVTRARWEFRPVRHGPPAQRRRRQRHHRRHHLRRPLRRLHRGPSPTR